LWLTESGKTAVRGGLRQPIVRGRLIRILKDVTYKFSTEDITRHFKEIIANRNVFTVIVVGDCMFLDQNVQVYHK